MSKEMNFFIYLLEKYAEEKGRSAADVLAEWKTKKLDSFFYNMYEIYHSEDLSNAFSDIDSMVATGKPAW